MEKNKIKIDYGKRDDEIFYKRMGDTKWYCRYCGAAHTEDDLLEMARNRLRSIEAIRQAVRSSFGGEHD